MRESPRLPDRAAPTARCSSVCSARNACSELRLVDEECEFVVQPQVCTSLLTAPNIAKSRRSAVNRLRVQQALLVKLDAYAQVQEVVVIRAARHSASAANRPVPGRIMPRPATPPPARWRMLAVPATWNRRARNKGVVSTSSSRAELLTARSICSRPSSDSPGPGRDPPARLRRRGVPSSAGAAPGDDRFTDRLGRFQHPVANHRQRRRRDGRAASAGPWRRPTGPHVRFSFEEARIDKVHAARPGNATVDHDDLAVQTEVVALDTRAVKQRNGQGRLHRYAGLPGNRLGLPSSPPGSSADALRSSRQRDAAAPAARISSACSTSSACCPLRSRCTNSIKTLFCAVDVVCDGFKDCLRLREQSKTAAAHSRASNQRPTELVHAARSGCMA